MNAEKSRIKNREASTHLRRDDDNFKDLIVFIRGQMFSSASGEVSVGLKYMKGNTACA